MTGRVILGAAAAIAFVAMACNALNGAGDLSVCEGAECAPVQLPVDEGGLDGNGGSDSGDGGLPSSCIGDEKRCSGALAAHCVGGQFQTTQCAEACLDGDCAPFLSCRNATGNTCGGADGGADGGVGNCCETIAVPGGTFNRNNETTKAATISGFKLDKLEVTVARFRAFVAANEGTLAKPPAASAGAHPKIANSGWNPEWSMAAKGLLPTTTDNLKLDLGGGTWTNAPGANEVRPITNVSWFVAFAFCAWDGARLPTNAEWNYAAAGGSEQRLYPWQGVLADDTFANIDCAYAPPSYSCTAYTYCSTQPAMEPCDAAACSAVAGSCLNGTRCSGCLAASTEIAVVGNYPKGAARWGHLDLAGNVAEWTLDASGDKDNIVLSSPCNDCTSLVPANPEGVAVGGNDDTFMVTRGGSWNTLNTTTPLRNTSAQAEQFQTKSATVGFRCARD